MAIVCPDVGEVLLLQYVLNMPPAPVGDKVMVLYKSDTTPAHGDTMGTFTPATDNDGPITLASAQWTVQSVGGTTTGLYSQQTFTFTTGAVVYGYYVTDITGAALLWAERFAGAPFTLPAGGGTIAVSPRLELAGGG